MKLRLPSVLVHFAQGLLMGGADIIPGVSGGTMALIVGIYRRLIGAISDIFSAVLDLVRLRLPDAFDQLRDVEWRLILPLGAGIATALVIGARIILFLLEQYPQQCLGLFFGLVAGSIVVPWQRIERKNTASVLIALGAAILAFILTGIPPSEGVQPSLLQVFGSAALAICAMILPGVSGAFILKVIGMYEVTLHALNARDVIYVVTFVLGAGIGLGTFSKLLNYLLEHRTNATMAALVGLMAGSLRALWPWQAADRALLLPDTGDPVWSVVLLAAAGFVFVTMLTVIGNRLEAATAS